jgi:ATP-binding cassette, subfamily B, bacterial
MNTQDESSDRKTGHPQDEQGGSGDEADLEKEAPGGMTIATFLGVLFSYLRPYRGQIAVLMLMLFVEELFFAGIPMSFKYLVDNALTQRNQRVLVIVLSILAGAAILATGCGLARDYLYAKLGARTMGNIRLRMFEHLQFLSIDFYARSQAGNILSSFSNDLASVESAIFSFVRWTVIPGLDIIIGTVLLFTLNWKLGLFAMLVWPMCLVGPRIFVPRAIASSYERKQQDAETMNTVQENISAQAVVKAFGLEKQSISRFRERNDGLGNSMVRFSFLSALIERTSDTGVQILLVFVLGVGAFMTFQGSMTIGSLAAFQTLFLMLSYQISYISQYVPTLLAASGGMSRIAKLLAERPQVADVPGAQALPRLSREIAFNDVVFSYTGDQPHLDDVSLPIKAGSSVAFVGPSGSGKSTVLNLLMRFYEPATGSVTLDGCDLRSRTQQSLREQFGVVFQENFLFNTTIRENICVGRRDAAQAEIEAAARLAEIHNFIMRLPEGYDTMVGERGGRLSGGQRQRIGIARAMLRDPAVLLLDEATSALDPGTEAALNKTLADLSRGRTTITVTHRLQSVNNMDCIFVLDRGRLAESGRHEELLARNGLYKQLWMKQSGFTLIGDGEIVKVELAKLKTYPIFSILEDAVLKELIPLFATEQVPGNRTVLHEGDCGDRFYVLVRGSVEVLRRQDRGNDKRIAVLQDGDYFGEISLLRNVPHTASIRTLIPCVFLKLQRAHFEMMLARSPHVLEALQKETAHRLASQNLH